MSNFSPLPLGEKLRQIRVAKGLSQENVANAIKSSVPAISRIEQGHAECSSERLTAIKKYWVSKMPHC